MTTAGRPISSARRVRSGIEVFADHVEIRRGLLRRRTESIPLAEVAEASASGPAHGKLEIRTKQGRSIGLRLGRGAREAAASIERGKEVRGA